MAKLGDYLARWRRKEERGAETLIREYALRGDGWILTRIVIVSPTDRIDRGWKRERRIRRDISAAEAIPILSRNLTKIGFRRV